MFCKNCGKELSAESRFCENCGAKVDKADLMHQIPNVRNLSKKQKLIGIICVVIVIAIIALCVILHVIGKIVDPFDYIETEMTGYNSMGNCYIHFDPDDEMKSRIIGLESENIDELQYDEWVSVMTSMFEVESAFKTKVEIKSGTDGQLSNGDILLVTITVNRDVLEKYDCRFTKDVYEATLEIGKDTPALPEPVTVNWLQFANIEVMGYNENGYITWSIKDSVKVLDTPINDVHAISITAYSNYWGTNEDKQDLHVFLLDAENNVVANDRILVICSKENGLSNGETISITTSESTRLKSYGVLTNLTETKLTVNNLEQGVTFDLLNSLDVRFSGLSGSGELAWERYAATLPLSKSVSGITAINVEVSPSYWGNAMVTISFESSEENFDAFSFNVYCSEDNGLSNGDSVTLLLDAYSEDIDKINRYGIKIPTECNKTVFGLDEPIIVDVFELLQYSFIADGNGTWELIFSGEPQEIEFNHPVLGISSMTMTVNTGPSWSVYRYSVDFVLHKTDEYGIQSNETISVDLKVSRDDGLTEDDQIVISMYTYDVGGLTRRGIIPQSTEHTIIVDSTPE